MRYLKMRLGGLLLIIISIGLIYYNWHLLKQEGKYYMKRATFAPVIGIGGLFILLFPQKGGRPETTRERLIALGVFAIGLIAGLINWYLMNPKFFSWLGLQ